MVDAIDVAEVREPFDDVELVELEPGRSRNSGCS
jgi:hypothetical protein